MADGPVSNLRTFGRHCIDGVCHCDWRITLHECEESKAMWIVNVVNIAVSALSILLATGLLLHRGIVKGHTIWNPKGPGAGILRPKPVDNMLLLFIIFNALRLLTSVVLITDIAHENWIARSFLYEIPWSIGLSGITLYLIGIAQTIAQSNSASGWLPSTGAIDAFGLIFIIAPLVVGESFTIAAGAMATKNLHLAETLIRINYSLWFIWTGGVGTSVMFAGIRLIRILRNHHKKFRQSKNYEAVKAGIYKIQLTAFSYVICLYSFATVLLLYGILRNYIMENTKGSIFLGVVWSLLAGATTLLVELAVLISPSKKENAALRTRSSSDNKTGTNNASNSSRADFNHASAYESGATDTFDNKAIMNALRAKDEEWLARREQLNNNALAENGLGNKIPKRRTSDNESQLELTSYEHHHH
ncbi:hypothetical protein BDB00DRAFT_801202 [Zychaea mexicana]|uniref:uncharacterized protein n=1 Tax=Zychaea mexicana TaxID=64656 RepID=UPI0022FE164F|nr:uncharacterized protein BDB00DRAFT_801202 [Zychaea mexicana]KAI9498118.1 hypothetical protein BDB00DRAFT_801202 [Zychaea mexicana]